MTKYIFSAFSDESGENTIEGQMAACKNNGITHMELRGFGDELNINNLSVAQAKEMKKKIDEAGMKVASIGSGYGKIEITDDFEPHFKQFKNTVEVAKILGAKYIRIFSFYFTEGESCSEYREEVLRRVRMMADYAAQNGLLCCHENEKAIYGDTAERCLDLLQNCGENLRAVFDPANFIQCGVDTLKAYELLKEHIEYFHVKDAIYENGSVVPAGKGEGHVEEIIAAASKGRAQLILSLEPHLQVFEGLGNLESKVIEGERTMPENTYPSHADSFKAAADAMHLIAKSISEKNADEKN